MPNVRNDGTNPVFVEDIRIRQGQTVLIPETKWKAFNANEIAKRTIAPFLSVVAGKGKDEGNQDPGGGGNQGAADDEAIQEAIAKMREEDGEKKTDLWLSDGRPDARELSERVGRRVSGAERNEAWERYLSDDNPDANGQ